MPTQQCPLLLMTAALVAGPSLEAGEAADASVATEVPFEMQGHLVVVRGSIGSRHRLRLLVDSGTSLTLIDRMLVRRLSGARESGVRVNAGRGGSAGVEALTVGGQRYRNFQALPRDLSGIAGPGIDMILGVDVLKQAGFTIDYQRRTIRFGAPDHSGARIRFHPQAALLLIPVRLCSGTVQLLLDTGARDTVLYDVGRTRELGDCLVRRPGRVALSYFYGQVHGHPILWPKMGIRQLERKAHPAALLKKKQQPSAPGNGILSPVDLGIRRLSVDFDRGVVILQEPGA